MGGLPKPPQPPALARAPGGARTHPGNPGRGSTPRSSPAPAGGFPAGTAIAGIATALAAGWAVARGSLYTSRSDLAYGLGLAGASMMLVLILYPVRKHVRLLRTWGPLKHWFRAHMLCGILGPLLILFHSAFDVRSLNAAVALGSMILVTASGVVGRYIYRRIHHGLYGSRATLEELQQELEHRFAALDPLLEWLPAVRREVNRFCLVATQAPPGWRRRTAHFTTLGGKRYLAERRIRRMIAAAPRSHGGPGVSRRNLRTLLRAIDATLRAAQRTAQFTTYERLFSLWHVLHVPIVYLLLISAIVHVLAVHMY
ncbi:MAG: hypothetical protein HYU51_16715 [Candidatus Rokubacteria bacterium]|nr:hypothetical protein [Candidatus Rokubacteria bacterium]